MNLKARVKRLLPAPVYNQILLTMPCLYRSGLFNYETNLEADDGITDLLTRLSEVKYLGGEVIECGSSRCGTSIIIANYLRQQGIEKKIYACDSFEGFDPAELTRERASGLTKARQNAFTSTSYRYVLQKIDRLGLSSQVVPVKGFFETTLPDLARFNEFCFALIDCDLYNSVLYCANEVWPRIMPGGCIVFDDYVSDEFRGARLAIDEFVKGAVPKIEAYGLMRRLFYVKKASQSGTLDWLNRGKPSAYMLAEHEELPDKSMGHWGCIRAWRVHLITHDLEESANMAMLDYEMRPYLKEEKLYGDSLGLMLFSPMVGTKMCEPVRKGCTSPIHTPLE